MPYPDSETSSSILDLFRSIVLEEPDHVALSDAVRRLSYRELDHASSALAVRLRPKLERSRRVVVLLPRSIEAVVAFLGILKAGGCYVPLDCKLPPHRLEELARDLEPALLIGERPKGALQAIEQVVVDLPSLLAEPLPENPEWARRDEDEAYIIFTSGSTGQPKGVSVPDRAIIRLVIDPNYVDLGPIEVILHFASNTFDAATFEIWGALLNGARLSILTEAYPSAASLGAFLQSEGVTIAWLTAGLFNALIDSDPSVLKGLKQLLTGGEALSVPHIAKAQQALPKTQLINGYGPTENTTFTCCYRIPRAPDVATWMSIPIGEAIRGSSVFVVDANLQPVPKGVEGELLTGGRGVALGYFNDAELSDRKFVECPNLGPGLFYRTGDVVVRRGDGIIEFRGRRDDQVKINGFRIELGEIVHHLKGLYGVQDAVVIPQSVGEAQKRLVGYIVPSGEDNLSESALQAALRKALPAYMVPSRVLLIETFPLNQNGKVDRKALPNPFGLSAVEDDSETGGDVAGFFGAIAEVLGCETVNGDCSFLQLGGDSLAAIRVVERWRRRSGKLIQLDALLSNEPLKVIEAKLAEKGSNRLAGSREEIPITDANEGPLSL